MANPERLTNKTVAHPSRSHCSSGMMSGGSPLARGQESTAQRAPESVSRRTAARVGIASVEQEAARARAVDSVVAQPAILLGDPHQMHGVEGMVDAVHLGRVSGARRRRPGLVGGGADLSADAPFEPLHRRGDRRALGFRVARAARQDRAQLSHVGGGASAAARLLNCTGSSAAGSPARRPPGRSPSRRAGRAARDAPGARAPRRTRPTGWPSWSAPTRSAPTTPNNAVGLLHEEMRRLRLAHHAGGRRPQGAGRRRAGGRPRRLLAGRHGGARGASADRDRREEVAGLPPEDWDNVIVATGPSPRPRWPRRSARSPARTRSPSSTPSRRSSTSDTIDMSKAWFQSRYDKAGPGGTGADYINCPMTRSSTRPSSTRCWPATRPSSRSGRPTPLFRRLPADRGDGRARPRDAALRADEAGRADQSAQADRPAAYAVVQLRQDNALGTLYNMVGFQTKLKYGEQAERLPHDPGAREGRVRAARRAAPQHLPQQPRLLDRRCG
jgi:hypothetical protein